MKIKEMLRKEIFTFVPYIPGKPIDEVKRQYKIKGKIVKLASNENAVGVSKRVIESIKTNLKNIYLYPESSCYYLKKKLANKLNISEDEIIVGSGSDELIELIGKTFFNLRDNIIVSEHAFIRYKMAGELMGCKVISVQMKNFTHNLEAMLKKVNKNTKAIFVANPNNPTGTYNTKDEVKKFIFDLNNICKKNKKYPLVIFDEAYYEYAKLENKYPEMLNFREFYTNLIILRTFSKIYALAGLRIGYGIMNKEIIKYIDRIRPPFNVNSIAQIAAISVIDDEKNLSDSIKFVASGKKWIYNKLDEIGLKYVLSSANFILINVSPYKGKDIFLKLLKEGIIVRSMDEYDFSQYIRVTIGKPEENKKFINLLKEIFERKKNVA